MDRKQELYSILLNHINKYYVDDDPEIDDTEYDELVEEYISLGGTREDLPLGQVDSKFEKVNHVFEIKSLDKVNEKEKLIKRMTELAPGVIQPKLDGLTIVIYPDGTLDVVNSNGDVVYSTRGTGKVGENISHTAKMIPGLHIPNNKNIVRVEAYMPISEFNRINLERAKQGLKLLKNTRNAAAGMLRNTDASKIEGLTYMAYNIIGSKLCETEQLNILKNTGFKTIGYYPFTKDNVEKAAEWILHFHENERDKLDYDIDGLVIKSNIPNALEVYGETGHHPKSMIAYKFPPKGEWTTLNEVVWQIGRTGECCPVAVFKMIDLLGADVERATLHNWNYIQKHGVYIGCRIYVIKANDVIPKVLKAETDLSGYGALIRKPTKCPICDKPLMEKGAKLFCTNIDCKGRTIGRVVHMAKKEALDITGLSFKTVEKMYEANMIKTPYDIFKVSAEQIEQLEGYAKKSAKTLYKNIQNARESSLQGFLYAAGAPLVGKTASEDIANKLHSFNKIVADVSANNCGEIIKIDGIGKEIVESIQSYLKWFVDLYTYVKPAIVPYSPASPTPKEQLTFVITGTFECKRKDIEKVIKKYGHKTSGSVSKKTNHLVCGEKAGSKLTKFTEIHGNSDKHLVITDLRQLEKILKGER